MRKSRSFFINSLLFASLLGAASISLASCNQSASKIETIITTTINYIKKNHTYKNDDADTYSYKISSGTYNGYDGEIYAFAHDRSNTQFEIKLNVNFKSYYMSSLLTFWEGELKEGKGLGMDGVGGNEISILKSKPSSTTFDNGSWNNDICDSGYFVVPLDYNSSSTILLKNFGGTVISQAEAEANGAVLVDLSLKYTSSFLTDIGCSIKDLGFVNY